MNTELYCDVCIIMLSVQTICIIPVLLYAVKYVNVVLCKSVDLVLGLDFFFRVNELRLLFSYFDKNSFGNCGTGDCELKLICFTLL